MARFKKEVLDLVKSNPDLFAAVANAMNVKPVSLPKILDRNGNNLNQYSIVTLVADHLNRNPEDLLEKDTEEVVQS